MEYRIPIPHIYRWIAKSSENPHKVGTEYAEAYIRSNYPELELVRFEKGQAGGYAVCIAKPQE